MAGPWTKYAPAPAAPAAGPWTRYAAQPVAEPSSAGLPTDVAPAQRASVAVPTVTGEIGGPPVSSTSPSILPDAGTLPALSKGIVRGAGETALEIPRAVAQIRGAVQDVDPRTLGLYQLADRGEAALRRAVPTTPEQEQRFSYKLGSGLGSTAAFAGAGVLGGPVGIAAAGSGANASQQFKDALAHDASLEDATRAAKFGALVGTTEAVPIARWFDRFDKATGGTLRRAAVEGLKGGAEELVQEVSQQALNNLIASDLVKYDPERGVFEGTGEAGGIGFTVGGLMSFLAGALGARVRGPAVEQRGEMPAAPDAITEQAVPQPAPERPIVPEVATSGLEKLAAAAREGTSLEPAVAARQQDALAKFGFAANQKPDRAEISRETPPSSQDTSFPGSAQFVEPMRAKAKPWERYARSGTATARFEEPMTAGVTDDQEAGQQVRGEEPQRQEPVQAVEQGSGEEAARAGRDVQADEGEVALPREISDTGVTPAEKPLPAATERAQGPVAAEKPSLPKRGSAWLDGLDPETKERVFVSMRAASARSDAHMKKAAELTPRGANTISVGAANFDESLRGDAIASVLRHLGNSNMTPAEAGEAAKREARAAIESHNAKRPNDVNWPRWEGAADSAIERAVQEIEIAARAPTAPVEQRPAPEALPQPTPAPSPAGEAVAGSAALSELPQGKLDTPRPVTVREGERETPGELVAVKDIDGERHGTVKLKGQRGKARVETVPLGRVREVAAKPKPGRKKQQPLAEPQQEERAPAQTEKMPAERRAAKAKKAEANAIEEAKPKRLTKAEQRKQQAEQEFKAMMQRHAAEKSPYAARHAAEEYAAAQGRSGPNKLTLAFEYGAYGVSIGATSFANDEDAQAAWEAGKAWSAPITTEQTPEGEQTVLPGAEQAVAPETAPDETIEFHAGLPLGKLWDWFLGPFFAKYYETMGRLPGGKGAYMRPRWRTQGKISAFEDATRRIHDRLNRHDDATKEAIYRYMTTAGATLDSVPPEARPDARDAKKMVDVIGQEMVSRGILDPAQHAKYKDAYLPRIYLKFLFQSEGVGMGGGNRPIVSKEMMGRLKKRKDLPQWERDILLGEIKDPAYLTAQAFGEAARSIAIWDLLEQVSKNSNWVFPESLVTWRGRKVTGRWLLSEAQRLRESYHLYPQANQAAVLAEALSMEQIGNTALAPSGNVPNPQDYKQVPDSKRYGQLRGMWVRKEIHDDLVGSVLASYDDDMLKRMVTFGRKANSTWKGFKTAWSISGQARNHIGGAMQAQLYGQVPLHRLPDMWLKTLYAMRHNGPAWQRAKKWGVKGTSFAQAELQEIHNQFKLKLRLQKYKSSPLRFLWEAASRLNDKVGDIYSLNEQFYKTLVMDYHVRQGMSEGEAAELAHGAIFDYSDVPVLVRHLRSAPLPYASPFATFMYKSIPKTIETALKRPWAYLPYAALIYGSWGMLQALWDLDDDDAETLWNLMPDWLDHGFVAMLPGKDEHGRWQPVDMSYIFPFTTVPKILKAAGEGDGAQVLKELGVGGHPAFSVPAALTTNQDWRGKPIYTEGAPKQQQLYEVFSYLMSQVLPPWAGPQGQVAKLANALEGRPNRFGEPGLTPDQAAARLFGVNITPIDPAEARATKLYLLNRDVSDAERVLSQIRRDRSLSSEERREAMREQREHIKELRQKVIEFRRETPISPELRSDAEAPGQEEQRQQVAVNGNKDQDQAVNRQVKSQLAGLIRSGDVTQIAELAPNPRLAVAAAREAGSPALAAILAA